MPKDLAGSSGAPWLEQLRRNWIPDRGIANSLPSGSQRSPPGSLCSKLEEMAVLMLTAARLPAASR